MKKIIILTLLVITSINNISKSQWVQTGGPEGANVSSIAISGTNVYAVSYHYGTYYSTNNGTNWILVNSNFPTDTTKLAAIGSSVFAGNINGVYISTDNGANWTLSNTGLPTNPHVYALVANGTDLYAGTTNGVYTSTDNGANWNAANSGLTASIKAIAISGTNIYASRDSAIYKSTNNGASWNYKYGCYGYTVLSLAASGNNVFAGSIYNIFASTNNGITWFATGGFGGSSNSLLVVGTNVFAGNSNGLCLSTNNGTNWTIANGVQKYVNISSIATDGTNIFAGGLNVYLSTNNGSNWSNITGVMTNSVANPIASFGSNIFVGNGQGLCLSTNNGANWIQVYNDYIYAVATDGPNTYIAPHYDILKSTNNGISWDSTCNSYLQIRSLFINVTDIFAGQIDGGSGSGCGGMDFRSTDYGTTWSGILYGCDNLYASAANGNNIYLGGEYSLYSSTDNGLNWSYSVNGLPNYFNAHSLAASNNSDVFAGSGSVHGIYKSTNNGINWFAANNGIPFQTGSSTLYTPVNALIFNGTDLYAGTGKGVYLSTDNGSSWTSVNNGFFPNISVLSLTINNNYLYAGTDGNGVWKCALQYLNLPSNKIYENSYIYPNPVKTSATIKYSVENKSLVSIKVYDITGKEVTALINKEQPQGKYEINFDATNIESGVYFYRLKTGNRIESKKIVVIK